MSRQIGVKVPCRGCDGYVSTPRLHPLAARVLDEEADPAQPVICVEHAPHGCGARFWLTVGDLRRLRPAA